MKFTTTTLIEFLEKFPKDLPIGNDLATIWEYPDELKELMNSMGSEEFKEYTMHNAKSLNIYQGSWEDGSVILREAHDPEKYAAIKDILDEGL